MALNIIDFTNLDDQLRSGQLATQSYLLDSYSALTAYSFRQLKTGQVNCIRIRESNGDTETDIGFSNGWLDEAAIASHCGAFNGFITKWYDQSGNAYDASQTTTGNQPKIYDGSVVIKVNSRPSWERQGTGTYLQTGTLATVTQPTTIFSTWRYSDGGIQFTIDGHTTNNDHRLGYSSSLASTQAYAGEAVNGGSLTTGTQLIQSALINSTSSILRKNGTEENTGNAGTEVPTQLIIGNWRALTNAANNLQEVIFFNSDQSANFTAIETDINTAFSVY